MKKLLLNALLLMGLSGMAFAGDIFTIHSTRAGQNPNDFIDWSQLATGNSYSTPQLVTSFNGNTALVGNIGGSDFVRVDEGLNWLGNFDYGETLVWTGNPNLTGAGPGPFALELGVPVSSVGFSLATDNYGPFTAQVVLYDSSFSVLGLFNFSGTSSNLENGSALFVGIGDVTGPNIGAVVISTDNGGDPFWSNDFAINDVSLGTVPEPGSVTLVGAALIGLAAVLRRKNHVR